jgi:hypothetical protein
MFQYTFVDTCMQLQHQLLSHCSHSLVVVAKYLPDRHTCFKAHSRTYACTSSTLSVTALWSLLGSCHSASQVSTHIRLAATAADEPTASASQLSTRIRLAVSATAGPVAVLVSQNSARIKSLKKPMTYMQHLPYSCSFPHPLILP